MPPNLLGRTYTGRARLRERGTDNSGQLQRYYNLYCDHPWLQPISRPHRNAVIGCAASMQSYILCTTFQRVLGIANRCAVRSPASTSTPMSVRHFNNVLDGTRLILELKIDHGISCPTSVVYFEKVYEHLILWTTGVDFRHVHPWQSSIFEVGISWLL